MHIHPDLISTLHLSVGNMPGGRVLSSNLQRILAIHKVYIHPDTLHNLYTPLQCNDLNRIFRQRLARNQLIYIELIKVIKELNKAGVEFLYFKGFALGRLYYPDMLKRFTGDIDILVSDADYQRVTNVLIAMGHELIKDGHRYAKERTFRHADNNVLIDLHRSLVSFNSGKLRFENFYATAQQVSLLNATVLTFSHSNYIYYLSIHGAMHMWCRLHWIKDFYLVLKYASEPALEQAVDKLYKHGFATSYLLGLKVLESFGMPVDNTCNTSAGLRIMLLHGLALKAINTHNLLSFKMRILKLLYQLVLFPRCTDKARIITGLLLRKMYRR